MLGTQRGHTSKLFCSLPPIQRRSYRFCYEGIVPYGIITVVAMSKPLGIKREVLIDLFFFVCVCNIHVYL